MEALLGEKFCGALGPVRTYFLNIKVLSIEAKIRVTGWIFGLSPAHRAQTEYPFVPEKKVQDKTSKSVLPFPVQ
jgi:hypothetical protein